MKKAWVWEQARRQAVAPTPVVTPAYYPPISLVVQDTVEPDRHFDSEENKILSEIFQRIKLDDTDHKTPVEQDPALPSCQPSTLVVSFHSFSFLKVIYT